MRTQTEEKKRAILDATIEEFEAKGFASARIEDIAKKAGVAKGTVSTISRARKRSSWGWPMNWATSFRGISSAL